MEWFKRVTPGLEAQTKRELPDGLWIKCDRCGEILYKKELERNFMVCTKCDFHFRMDSQQYAELLADEGSFKEFNAHLAPADPLNFKDSKKYSDRLRDSIAKTGMNDAVRTGEATLAGIPVVMALMDFRFIGGSMGSVVGEKVARAIDLALKKRKSLIILSASGGARMQEGALSLMQMAKTSAKLALLSDARIPYISLLTDPTAGGTTASFSMLGDVIIAEPEAFIGFAGPRVIKQTIGQDLPEGFQRSEFVQNHGFVDLILHRRDLKENLARLLEYFGAKAKNRKPVPAAASTTSEGERESKSQAGVKGKSAPKSRSGSKASSVQQSSARSKARSVQQSSTAKPERKKRAAAKKAKPSPTGE
jgi:acetyl-CoA carboxylase carboxyl transferase subunit beta